VEVAVPACIPAETVPEDIVQVDLEYLLSVTFALERLQVEYVRDCMM
jgi:hypothetical protein